MRFYEYKCDCGQRVEVNDSNPPTCPCGRRMNRVFTPCYFAVKGGEISRSYSKRKEQEQGIAEYEAEQKQREEGMRERRKADREAFRDYCAAELHHKHGTPEEATTALPKSIRGE